MLNLKPDSAQRQVVSKEMMVDGEALDEEENEKEKIMCLFRNSISVHIYHVFLHYRPLSGNDGMEEESIMQLARFHFWAAPVLTFHKRQRHVVGIDSR